MRDANCESTARINQTAGKTKVEHPDPVIPKQLIGGRRPGAKILGQHRIIRQEQISRKIRF